MNSIVILIVVIAIVESAVVAWFVNGIYKDVQENRRRISNNANSIATNRQNIETNRLNISSNRKNIESLVNRKNKK